MTKQQILNAIADKLALTRPVVSTGSSEPRDFLVKIIDRLGISEETARLTKPELASLIVVALGGEWDESCYSAGSTVTKVGLERILSELTFL